MKRRLLTWAAHLVLVIGALAAVGPLVWMVLASLVPAGEANALAAGVPPSRLTLEHYQALFSRLDIGRNFLNSAFLAAAVTLLSLLCNSLAGYAFAKLRFPGRGRIFGFLIASMVIPGQVAMLPLFLLLRNIGLVNSFWGVIVPGLASVFGIFLIRQYAQSIPDELLDAARVDGAGEGRIYWQIALPLCKPVLVTLALFTFLGSWNDFMWPLIILTDERNQTLPVALASLVGEHVQDTELMMAGAVITVAPVLLLFLVLQRSYIAGIMLGGVKE